MLFLSYGRILHTTFPFHGILVIYAFTIKKKIALDHFIIFFFFFFCLAQSSLLKEKIDIFNYNKSNNISSNRDGLMILS